MPNDTEKTLTSKDVKTTAGLSYRQLNEWDSKGVLPEQDRPKKGWRRYTPRQVFALMVMAELRRQYGVSVESLRIVREFILKEEHDPLQSAIQMIALLDLPVLLVTDLKNTILMEPANEVAHLLFCGIMNEQEEEMPPAPSLIIMNISPLVRRLLSCLKPPIELPKHQRGMDLWFSQKTSIEEQNILQLIRNDDYFKVEVRMKNGKIISYAHEQNASFDNMAEISRLLQGDDFQTLNLIKRDGQVVSIRQKVNHKPNGRRDGQNPSAPEESQ